MLQEAWRAYDVVCKPIQKIANGNRPISPLNKTKPLWKRIKRKETKNKVKKGKVLSQFDKKVPFATMEELKWGLFIICIFISRIN